MNKMMLYLLIVSLFFDNKLIELYSSAANATNKYKLIMVGKLEVKLQIFC